MIDALARRQLAAQILFDEIHQSDDDLRHQDRNDEKREQPVYFEPAENEEQKCIKHVAQAVQAQLEALRRPPGQALRELVVIEGVEHPHGDLDRDQGPKQRRHDMASRNTAD
jgi:hypothetical protein